MSGAGRKRDSRFSKGKSGNWRGRPHGSQNLRTILGRELARHISIMTGDGLTRMTTRDALEHVLVLGAAKGSLAHLNLALELDLLDKHEPLIIELYDFEKNA